MILYYVINSVVCSSHSISQMGYFIQLWPSTTTAHLLPLAARDPLMIQRPRPIFSYEPKEYNILKISKSAHQTKLIIIYSKLFLLKIQQFTCIYLLRI